MRNINTWRSQQPYCAAVSISTCMETSSRFFPQDWPLTFDPWHTASPHSFRSKPLQVAGRQAHSAACWQQTTSHHSRPRNTSSKNKHLSTLNNTQKATFWEDIENLNASYILTLGPFNSVFSFHMLWCVVSIKRCRDIYGLEDWA